MDNLHSKYQARLNAKLNWIEVISINNLQAKNNIRINVNKPNWIEVTSMDDSLAKSKVGINAKLDKLDKSNMHRYKLLTS